MKRHFFGQNNFHPSTRFIFESHETISSGPGAIEEQEACNMEISGFLLGMSRDIVCEALDEMDARGTSDPHNLYKLTNSFSTLISAEGLPDGLLESIQARLAPRLEENTRSIFDEFRSRPTSFGKDQVLSSINNIRELGFENLAAQLEVELVPQLDSLIENQEPPAPEVSQADRFIERATQAIPNLRLNLLTRNWLDGMVDGASRQGVNPELIYDLVVERLNQEEFEGYNPYQDDEFIGLLRHLAEVSPAQAEGLQGIQTTYEVQLASNVEYQIQENLEGERFSFGLAAHMSGTLTLIDNLEALRAKHTQLEVPSGGSTDELRIATKEKFEVAINLALERAESEGLYREDLLAAVNFYEETYPNSSDFITRLEALTFKPTVYRN